ncbi:hypothetical protein AB5N19_10401 [Seiridium cardinale]
MSNKTMTTHEDTTARPKRKNEAVMLDIYLQSDFTMVEKRAVMDAASSIKESATKAVKEKTDYLKQWDKKWRAAKK